MAIAERTEFGGGFSLFTFRAAALGLAIALTIPTVGISAEDKAPENIARMARATASSAAEEASAENANDGDIAHTQWTAKDGTDPASTWLELNWPGVVRMQEVVIRQEADQKLSHVKLDVRDAAGKWKELRSIGDSQHLLPRIILVQFERQSTSGIRLSSFTGRVSLVEVEVYDRVDPPVIELASDLRNHILGIVTDGFGTVPFANVPVDLTGADGGKDWHDSARTNDLGMFQVEMPVGLKGKIVATAHLANGLVPTRIVQAGDLSPGLELIDDNSPKIDLNGAWRFQTDPAANFFQPSFSDSDWKTINVPSHWIMEGFSGDSEVAGYRRHVQIPPAFRGRRIKVLFEGVYSGAVVWLNGQRVGSHEGGFAPFELDATDAARVGEDNMLAVLVREKTVSSRLDDMSSYANFPLAGIFRPVMLFTAPETHVRRFHIQTIFDSSYRDAILSLDLSVENESGHVGSGSSLEFTLTDPEGRTVPLSNDRLNIPLGPWSRLERQIEFHVASPVHWEAEHPRLYHLIAKLSGPTGEQEVVSRRLGFRQVEIRGTNLLINGTPVKLRGVGYFETHPLTGRTISPDLERSDLQMMKEGNLDAFRTEVILPAEHLYDLADEMGFYVEAEGPFCWVDETSNLRYLPTFVQHTAEILDRDRSHASVIIWSVGNESSWGPDFEAAHQFVKAQDSTRPASAGQSTALELDTMHNPISFERMKELEDSKVPVIWDESFCIFQGDLWGDTREIWLDPGDRDYYIAPLIPIWDAVQTNKYVQGSMIWAWVDDIFLVPGRDSEYGRGSIGQPQHLLDRTYHMPGRGIVGDAPWGIVDGWRRKKPEFWHVKMLMSPVHLQSRDLPHWKPGEAPAFVVDNRYEFTNLSELSLEWSLGNQRGTLHPDIAPRTSGKIAIPLAPGAKPGDVLSLRFLDPKGQLIIPHQMQLGVPAASAIESSPKPGSLRYLHEVWLGGPLERFIGDNFEISFDGGSGRIRRALIDRQSVLYETPKLHVLPIASTLNEFPIFESWRLTKPLEIHPLEDGYEIVETGVYQDFAGELRFRVTPLGKLLVSYSFTYTGTDTRAREIGLQIGVPLWCDKLQWRRHGEWSVYPEDHIGRNDGVAMAHAPAPQPVPPTQAFNLDDTPIGTNDFRSSKRDFIFASLTDKEGYGVGIEAIGSQHLRASVDNDFIEVNVNDWFGGVAATAWGEWWKNYGQGRELRPDDPNEGAAHNQVSGSMQLYLLSPQTSSTWLSRMKATPVANDN